MLGLLSFYLAKLLEALGLLMMPVALYYGVSLEGTGAMVVELKLLFAGVVLFTLGRTLEAATGKRE